MMQTGYELLLPAGLLDYFEVVQVETLEKNIILHLDENVLTSEENTDNQFISKGFYPPTDIHIARIETGKANITISTLNDICSYFGVSLSEFFSTFE